MDILQSPGVTAPDGLSKWGASKMIGKLMKRKAKGEASAVQVQALLAYGVDAMFARSMSVPAAKAAIIELDASRTALKTQRSMF